MKNFLVIINNKQIQNYMASAIKNLSDIENSFIWINIDNSMKPISDQKWSLLEKAVNKRNRIYAKNPLELVTIDEILNTSKNVKWKNSTDNINFDWIILEDSTIISSFYDNFTKNGYVALEFSSHQIIQESIHNKTISISYKYRLPSASTWKYYKVNLGLEKSIKNNWEKVLWSFSVFLTSFVNQDFSNIIDVKEPILYDKEKNFTTKLIILRNQLRLVLESIKRSVTIEKLNWKIAFSKDDRLYFLNQPNNSYWADPFFLEHNGLKVLFFEELDISGKGVISALTLTEHFEIIEKKVIIDEDFHLSFPNVFIENNQVFMIPESASSNKVILYHCENFPFDWTQKKIILDETKLIDIVWTKFENKYWLFANKIEDFEYENNERLNLYYSLDFLSDKWLAHPQNPIVVNKKNARNAGKIINNNGKIIRVCQNCKNSYGENLSFCEIKSLTSTLYMEKAIKTIYPQSPFCGQHTWNNSFNDYKVTDFLIKE